MLRTPPGAAPQQKGSAPPEGQPSLLTHSPIPAAQPTGSSTARGHPSQSCSTADPQGHRIPVQSCSAVPTPKPQPRASPTPGAPHHQPPHTHTEWEASARLHGPLPGSWGMTHSGDAKSGRLVLSTSTPRGCRTHPPAAQHGAIPAFPVAGAHPTAAPRTVGRWQMEPINAEASSALLQDEELGRVGALLPLPSLCPSAGEVQPQPHTAQPQGTQRAWGHRECGDTAVITPALPQTPLSRSESNEEAPHGAHSSPLPPTQGPPPPTRQMLHIHEHHQENTHRPRGAPKCTNGHFQSSRGHNRPPPAPSTETPPALRLEPCRSQCLLPGRARGRSERHCRPLSLWKGSAPPGLDFVSPLFRSRRGTNQRLGSGFGGAERGSPTAPVPWVGIRTPATPRPAAGLLIAPKDPAARHAVPAHVASWDGRWEPDEGRSRAALLPHSEARGGGEDGGTSPERIPAAAAPFPKATAAYAMSDARPSAPTNFGICAPTERGWSRIRTRSAPWGRSQRLRHPRANQWPHGCQRSGGS